MSKKVEERYGQIMQAILRAGTISVQELVDQVDTSAASIRRNLVELERRGLILRTHGGATLVEPQLYEPFRYDTSFQVRELHCAEEKRRIGLAAAQLIQEKDMVGLSAGSTTTQIGRALRHRSGISVITNALNIGMELCNQPAIKTTLTGGRVAWIWEFALAGQSTINSLKEVYLDKAFLGVNGVDAERGVTMLEPEEATVAQAMIQQAKQVIVVADSSKIHQVSPAFICPLSSVHTLVTDSGISEDAYQALTEKGIQVIRA